MFFRSLVRLQDSQRLSYDCQAYSTPEHVPQLPMSASENISFLLYNSRDLFSSFQTRIVLCEIKKNTAPVDKMFDDIRSGNILEVVRHIKDGFDLRQTDSESWTALHWAVEYGRLDLVLILLDAEPLLLHMRTREGLSALSIAAWTGNVPMVELLLAQGSDVSDKTKWGETPLHHAVSFGNYHVCKTLLAAEADPTIEDKMERSPCKLAFQKGTLQIRELLSTRCKND